MPYIKHQYNFFAAANTGSGFISHFDGIFGALGRLYIIKGGSGTGKSRMMSEIAAAAEERGLEVEYYYCSADAESLDGLIIPALDTGVIDGTAPHMTDPKYPGAVDEIVNVGGFWDGAALRASAREIRELSDTKKTMFSCAYDFLHAAGDAACAARRLSERALLIPKINSAAERLTRRWKQGSGARTHMRILDAYTMKGAVCFDTFRRCAGSVTALSGKKGAAPLLLAEIARLAAAKNQPVCIAPDPLDMTRLNELWLPELDTAFVRDAPGLAAQSVINTDRFCDPAAVRRHKPLITEANKRRRELTDSALGCLSEAAKLHFRLEEIYSSAMDFKAKEELTRRLCGQIFG